jgi:SAM-dependent methyltransferase
MLQKLAYLLRSIRNSSQPRNCPNCGGTSATEIDRKYLVTRLLKCDRCKLAFRHPTDTQRFLTDFYQSSYHADYSNETLNITDLPSPAELEQLVANNFPDKRNHSPFVTALLKSSAKRVLDYGTSWGYSVHHLRKAGFDAEGFEISKPRAEFGRKLGVNIYSDLKAVPGSWDMIMSNHAIEHLPVISDFVSFAADRLKPEGIFMTFCPNGSPEYRKREPSVFHVNWGFLHPNYLDVEFAMTTFKENPYLILTGDWNYDVNDLATWDGHSQSVGERRDGKELLIISKPNIRTS